MKKNIDILVIGAGQAGLAIGYYLKQTKHSFVLVDAVRRIGDVWRNRYDSLILFSPRRYSALPGMALPGDPAGFPTKDEMADYLETYANYFAIPVHLHTKVERLESLDDTYQAATSQGDFMAQNVVIATGPFQKPFIPKLPGALSENIHQIHSSEYRRPSQLPEGPVLVIGAGNSGAHIAAELSNSRKVYLSVGHEIVIIPRQIWKRSIFWWLDISRLSRVSVGSRLAKFLQKTEPIISMELKPLIASGKLHVKERAFSFHEKEIAFTEGTKISVDSIIWATGYQFDFGWVDIPGVLDEQAKPIHQRGISPVKGIYFLGLPWLYRVGSAQLNGIGFDARYLYELLR